MTTGEISAHFATSTTRRCPRTPLAGHRPRSRGDDRLAYRPLERVYARCSSTPCTSRSATAKSAPAVYARGRSGRHRDVLGMWAVKVTANRPSTGWQC
ncbi:putative transposase domain protein [Mycobacterium ulcerans str. Harvey]|uniref:Transposase domain protein n=1 Tax=Mycobacterium ulcerans str. Harvey TaxID=1299332 RepID=A0ABN0RAE6_MYCUL|nr:putative transposase domain protein [Mycobacterium ulcerans str. Harvey]